MKKILIYLLSFILIIFIIPAFLTKRTTPTSSKKETERQLQDNNQQEQTTENQTEISNKNTYNYSKYGTISLLHKKTGEVEQVNLEKYLCNVVSAEMPATFEQEALKAQAIVARTYTIYKILNKIIINFNKFIINLMNYHQKIKIIKIIKIRIRIMVLMLE